jgi:uncharacterized protein (DUF4415 family)
MQTRKPGGGSEWVDPDEAPHLTREWFERADLYRGDKLIRPEERASTVRREEVNLRLDADVLEYFRKAGHDWRIRINEALRKGGRAVRKRQKH